MDVRWQEFVSASFIFKLPVVARFTCRKIAIFSKAVKAQENCVSRMQKGKKKPVCACH
jgi:hypothetical protein